MTALGNVFGNGLPVKHEVTDRFQSTRGVGIEIELENIGGREERRLYDMSRWRHEPDGSLRDGIELISPVVFGKQLEESLDEAFEVIRQDHVTWRTGLHVHVDVRDKTAKELHSICSLYAVLEKAMFAIEGNDRQTSRFCIPWYSQPVQVAAIAAACINEDGQEVNKQAGTMGKYSALNLIPISRQGSIEFRQALMDSDKDKISKWILLCQSIVDNATTLQSRDILMMISSDGPVDAIRGIIGDPWPEMYDLYNFSDLVWDGVDIANMLEEGAVSHKKAAKSAENRCDYQSIARRVRN